MPKPPPVKRLPACLTSRELPRRMGLHLHLMPIRRITQIPHPASRQSPVPWGQSWPTPDGLVIRVVGVDLDAWPRVLAENQFNDPPAEGMRMVMVSVEVTNQDGDAETPRKIDDSDYRVVGDRGVIYSSFDSITRCGVIPDELDWELFPAATVTGNVCVMLPQDEGELRLIYKPGSDWGEEVVYFDLAE